MNGNFIGYQFFVSITNGQGYVAVYSNTSYLYQRNAIPVDDIILMDTNKIFAFQLLFQFFKAAVYQVAAAIQ